MRRAVAALKIGAVAGIMILLAACARSSDAEQDSLCRRAIPAVIDGQITVIGSETNRAGDVFVRFRRDDDPTPHFVFCRFAGSGLSLAKRRMTRIGLDGTTLGPSATHYVVEGWLETQDAVAAMPPPARRAPLFGTVSTTTGYGLQQAVSALPRMGIYALLAAAYALLYGLIGRINLAFGAFAALGGIGAVLSVLLMERLGSTSLGLGIGAGMVGAVAMTALYGSVAARLVIAPMLHRPGQHMLVASVGLMVALEEFLRLAQGARTLWLAPVFNAALPLASTPDFDVTVTPMALITSGAALAVAGALLVLLARSHFGWQWRAASEEPVAAELFGISHHMVVTRTFALAAALAGFAGLLVALLYGGIGYAGGGMLGLTALVAAVLGGIGSVSGAMLGGCLIGAFEAGWSALLPGDWREAVLFAVLAVFLALKPDGLFGGRQPGLMRV